MAARGSPVRLARTHESSITMASAPDRREPFGRVSPTSMPQSDAHSHSERRK